MVKTVDESPPIPGGDFRNHSRSSSSSSVTNVASGRRGRSDSASSEDSCAADARAAEANRLLQERYKAAEERYQRARLTYTKQDEDADDHCIQRSFDPVSKDFADPDAFCYWRDDASNYMVRIFDRFTWQGLLATPQRSGLISHPIYGAKFGYDPAVVMAIISAPMQSEHRQLLLQDKADYEGRKAAREELEDARKLHQLLHQELFLTDVMPTAGQGPSIPLLLPDGTRERQFQPTTKWESHGKERMDLQSITGMFTYQHYSFEELRLQDLMHGIRGYSVWGIQSFAVPTSASPWVVSAPRTTEIPFAGAAGSYTGEVGDGNTTHYFDSITGMNEYMDKSIEELRLEYLIAGRGSTNSGLEAIFDSLNVTDERMSDCTDDHDTVVLQSFVPCMSFEEIRFQATAEGRQQSIQYQYRFPRMSFEEIRFQAMSEGRRH